MTNLKEKLCNNFDIISGDRGFMYHCNPETLDAIADLAKILLDEDLIIGSKKALRKKLKVDTYNYDEDNEYTAFKTSINYQYIGLTKIVNNFKKDIEENIKELFMQDLENKFLNEGSEDNE